MSGPLWPAGRGMRVWVGQNDNPAQAKGSDAVLLRCRGSPLAADHPPLPRGTTGAPGTRVLDHDGSEHSQQSRSTIAVTPTLAADLMAEVHAAIAE